MGTAQMFDSQKVKVIYFVDMCVCVWASYYHFSILFGFVILKDDWKVVEMMGMESLEITNVIVIIYKFFCSPSLSLSPSLSFGILCFLAGASYFMLLATNFQYTQSMAMDEGDEWINNVSICYNDEWFLFGMYKAQ